ncbi:MAG TPA: hypothetical protein VIC71_12660 [Gammaproteobacteria bacterium]|jgi:hypothetical protein
MADNRAEVDINMDAAALYREETFTDRRVGTVQRLTPIDRSGNPDSSRSVLYVGQTQVLTPAGSLPLSFEIPAQSLDEAVQKFGAQAEVALTSTMRRLEELRREAASSIIVPGAAPPGGLKMR